MSGDSPSSTPTSHDLYIVHRPLEHPLNPLLKIYAKVSKMTDKEILHCGVRSIADDEYRYDYHIEGDEVSQKEAEPKYQPMKYITATMANSYGVHAQRRKGAKTQDPSEQIASISKMSGQQIKKECWSPIPLIRVCCT